MLNKKHKEEIKNLEKFQQEDSRRIEELEQQLSEWGEFAVRKFKYYTYIQYKVVLFA